MGTDFRFLYKGPNLRGGLSHQGYMCVLIIRERFPFSGVMILGFCHRTPEVAGGLKMNDKITMQSA